MTEALAVATAHPALAAPAAPALRPLWLRPIAGLCVISLHVLLLLAVRNEPSAISPTDSLEVSLVPLGDAAEDQKAQEEIKPQETVPPPTPSVQSAELTEPPQQTVPEASSLPVETSNPVAAPTPKPAVEEDHEPTATASREIERKKREAAEKRRKAQEARQETRRGAAGGSQQADMSQANYASLLIAEINRHKFFPAAAREAGVTGSVGVAFTVGPSGRVVSQSITRSSGNAALDNAAHAIISAVSAPPPPAGTFLTRTNIRFNLD